MIIIDDNTDYKLINERDEKIGLEIAEMLNLKKIKDERGSLRFHTSFGTKTEVGLARSIKRIFEENGA
jgi:hypothetical protein